MNLQERDCTVEIEHLRAARRLIQEVAEVIQGTKKLSDIFTQWEGLMVDLRKMEKRHFIESEPSLTDLNLHRELVNSMILCADSITSIAGRYLEIGYHLDATEQGNFSAQINLVESHRKILALEFNGWHGPFSQAEVNEEMKRFSSDSRREAA